VITGLLSLAPDLKRLNGATVVVACSGGADSTALLALGAAAGAIVHAVYVDHGLRADSADDFVAVRAAATAVGAAAAHCRRVDVVDGPNLEARARAARYAALEDARVELDAEFVLVGHTMDDQAETVLLALLRGSARAGLGGMPARRGAIIRPLLGLRRADCEALCVHLGLTPLQDAMNANPRFRRVWVRGELLPLLNARSERDLVPVLARQAQVMRAESDYLDAIAAAALEGAGVPPSAKRLAALDPVVARRAVRLMLGSPPIPLAQVDAVLEVASGRRAAVEVAGGRAVRRRAGVLVVTRGTLDTAAPPAAGRDRDASDTVMQR
jgi:tRNA(Ile)-lysidine synthase